ncbi:MAG TPA: N-acetylglucosamine-6-phosphate deacetylase [Clostridia bacterium]|nr:N-acetylglucosamine-6-phosphate deacetylase [Clostridia bacterium]
MNKCRAIINGRIITPKGILTGSAVIFDDRVLAVVPESETGHFDIAEKLDVEGCFVSPGFIDIHTHGAVGHDIMDGSAEGIRLISEKFASFGVTGFLATTMTMDTGSIRKALDSIREAMQDNRGARVLGCHLEGPFISRKYPGAQAAVHTKAAEFSLIKDYGDVIKLVTVAPEIEGSGVFIRQCIDENIAVSIGHSSATYEEAAGAFRLGAGSVTHTFNAMPALHHREPGIIGAAMDDRDVFCELIADNIHVHPVMQRVLLKSKGTGRLILITDSMRAAGMTEGCYELGGQTVYVRDNSARLENGTLAGSVLTMDRALYNFIRNTGTNVWEAVGTVTANPAAMLGLEDRLGSIEKGLDADITVFDEKLNIRYTFIKGCLCYKG